MKHQKIRVVKYFLSLILILFYSCKENKESVRLLDKAKKELEVNPKQTLILLDSIYNPDKLEKADYMEFVVIRVQAKIKTQADISSDTLVFEAQDYYNRTGKAKKAGLTNFLAGRVYRARGLDDKALESYLSAEKYGKETRDYLLIAKSKYNMGNLYFTLHSMEEAVTRYKEAFENYAKVSGCDNAKLDAINLIGRSYDNMESLDSAMLYFNKGLSMAKEQNNQQYEATFTHLTGMVYRKMGNYDKSVEYLHNALNMTNSKEESLRICLGLARLYSDKNQLDSVNFYSEVITNGLPDISDDDVLRSMYKSLSDFHLQNRDYENFIYYNNLREQVNIKILEADNKQNLSNVESKYLLSLSKNEVANIRQQTHIIIYSAIVVILFLLLIGFLILRNKRIKREKENELLKQKVESLSFLQDIYQHVIIDWLKIDHEVQKLAKELGAKEEPELYKKIKQLITDIKEKSNIRLLENAKAHILQLEHGEKALSLMTDQEVLIFFLDYHGYDKNEVAAVLGRTNRAKYYPLFKGIRKKFIEAGMSEDTVFKLVYHGKPGIKTEFEDTLF